LAKLLQAPIKDNETTHSKEADGESGGQGGKAQEKVQRKEVLINSTGCIKGEKGYNDRGGPKRRCNA